MGSENNIGGGLINFTPLIDSISEELTENESSNEVLNSDDSIANAVKYYKDNNIEIPDIPQFKNSINKGIVDIKDDDFKEPTPYVGMSLENPIPYDDEIDVKIPYKEGEGSSSKSKSEIIKEIQGMDIDDERKTYLEKLAQRESNFETNIENDFGYYGLYQFGSPALKTIGKTKEDFAKDTMAQHLGALEIAKINERVLKPIINAYVGKEFKGDKITLNGIRAAAHLLGAQTVKDYFNGTTKTKLAKGGFKDGYDTHISEYLKLMS